MGRVVRLAGRLESPHIVEIRRVCAEAPGAVHLDLAWLLSADDGSLEALVGLAGHGVRLVGASPYLSLQLDLVRERQRRRGLPTTGNV